MKHSILQKLQGGDLRSIGAADEVAQAVLTDASLVAVLMLGIKQGEPVVRMRCADVLEKASRDRSEFLQVHAVDLQGLLNTSQAKEVLWHLLQMVPRVTWSKSQLTQIFLAVENCLTNTSSIVKACAMQALVDLLVQAPEQMARVQQHIAELSVTGTAAMRSRGKKLLRQLSQK